MNVDELRRKLIAAARANPPSDHVPYAFEKRIHPTSSDLSQEFENTVLAAVDQEPAPDSGR